MSDLYLTLRRRLEVVTKWVPLGTETMRNARDARGLSMESMGRLLHVSAKTYDRWEKRGEVPSYALASVAAQLGLEIEREDGTAIKVASSVDEWLPRLRAELEAELGRFRSLNDALAAELARPRPARSRPSG